MLLVILASLAPVFGIILLGAFAARRELLHAKAVTCLNQYVYWIALPSMFFRQLAGMGQEQLSGGLFAGIGLGLLAAYVPCFLLIRFLGRDAKYATAATCTATFPNVMFMAVPIISFLLPGNEEAVFVASLAALLYLPLMLYTDTALDLQSRSRENFKQSLKSLFRSISRNPSIIAPSLGLAFAWSGIAAPAALLNMAGMLGNTAAPCALFATGMVLHMELAGGRDITGKWLLAQAPVHLTKLFLMPLLTLIALRLFGVDGLLLGVAVLCSAMPSAVAANVLAEKYQVAVKDTSLGICLNTAVSMISLSLWISVLHVKHIL